MSKYYTGLHVACEVMVGKRGGQVPCSSSADFPNPNGEAPYLMERLAIKAGWFLPLSGRVRCPTHHKEEAERWGQSSLYTELTQLSVPVTRPEMARGRKLEA